MEIMQKIKRALKRAGLEFRAVEIVTPDFSGVMVIHDYFGPYPSREACKKHETACNIASRYNAHSEERGFYSATLIYIKEA